MAGLEVLFSCVAEQIRCPQDALVCFVHWEMIKAGYRCLGCGDEPGGGERPSELLPAGWSSDPELYSLRYRGGDSGGPLVLKAIAVDATLIFHLMSSGAQQVSDLMVALADHVDAQQLHSFPSVFKDADALSQKVAAQLLKKPQKKSGQEDREAAPSRETDGDPLRRPTRTPPHWPEPLAPPFAAGGADLDPFGSRGGGGMIVDPLRSGFPRSGFDPSAGIPDILPPGAVPPGARFDPFGPVGRHRPGPDPDHMPPPGYDDMFM